MILNRKRNNMMSDDKMCENTNLISITKKEYDQLIKDQKWLQALESAGVDNWEGIDIAKESFND